MAILITQGQHFWTPEEDAVVAELFHTNDYELISSEILARTGTKISVTAIKSRAAIKGLYRRKRMQEYQREVKAMAKQGYTPQQMAEELGVEYTQLRNWLRRLGLSTSSRNMEKNLTNV